MMSDEWEDEGLAAWEGLGNESLNWILPISWQTHIYNVRNNETNERRQIRVEPGQSIGEAIAQGQWED